MENFEALGQLGQLGGTALVCGLFVYVFKWVLTDLTKSIRNIADSITDAQKIQTDQFQKLTLSIEEMKQAFLDHLRTLSDDCHDVQRRSIAIMSRTQETLGLAAQELRRHGVNSPPRTAAEDPSVKG
jgi:predicted PurR-regulated permease PerM